MERWRGYRRTVAQYLATPKGRFDARKYAEAAALILASMTAATVLTWQMTH